MHPAMLGAMTDMNEKPEVIDPVDRARELAPTLRAFADDAERERRLPEPAAQAMARAGLYRTAAPRSVGGFECEPEVQIETIEAIAAVDGSTGWNLMIGIEVMGFLGATLEPAFGAALFADPDLIVSGALNPVGVATRVEGGYRVNGQWPFASGCHNAHYFWGQCQVRDADGNPPAPGEPALREALIPRDEFEILDTWRVSGMRGSGSHDVQATDVFVPDERMTAVLFEPTRETGVLFRLPPFSRLAYNKVGVSTGIARSAIDQFVELASTHSRRAVGATLRERADVQIAVADADTRLGSARAFVLDAVGAVWQAVAEGRDPTTPERARVHLACSNAATQSIRAVDLVCGVAGTKAIFESSPLERCQRDVRVVPQHITVAPQWNANAGRVLLGLPSGSLFF
jgi:alkylation response protein AidB-like acyl-CoA dehydrogenase